MLYKITLIIKKSYKKTRIDIRVTLIQDFLEKCIYAVFRTKSNNCFSLFNPVLLRYLPHHCLRGKSWLPWANPCRAFTSQLLLVQTSQTKERIYMPSLGNRLSVSLNTNQKHTVLGQISAILQPPWERAWGKGSYTKDGRAKR